MVSSPESGINNSWLDARDIVRTDTNFTNAKIDVQFTGKLFNQIVLPLFKDVTIIITQSNIGSTDENENTRFANENPGYTAEIFAGILNVQVSEL